MTPPLLSNFINPTLTCSQQATTLELMAKMADGKHDVIAVIDVDGHPLGIIRLKSLINHLCRLGHWPMAGSSAVPPTCSDCAGNHGDQLDSPLLPAADILEPCELISAESSVTSWWSTFEAGMPTTETSSLSKVRDSPSNWIVVDHEQRYLGLLDCEAAWQWLVQAAYRQSSPQFPSVVAPAPDQASERAMTNIHAYGAGMIAASQNSQLSRESSMAIGTASNLPSWFTQHSIIQREQAWLLELSHELKSPLTSLLGLSALLQDSRLGVLNERQTRYVQLIHQGVRQLIAQVNYLLDWARIEAGQLTLSPRVVDLNQLWPQVKQGLCTQSVLTSQDLEGLDSRLLWPETVEIKTVVADPLRLQQILQHLISNALKHTDQDTVCGLTVEVWGTWTAITVWDQGDGIPTGWQSLLFPQQPLLPTGEDARQNRMNLALMLSWQLARLHGGDLSFVSSARQGNRFTLLLPNQDESESSTAPVSPSSVGTKLLLLACAEPDFIEAVLATFQGTHYRLAIARSLAEVVDKLTRLHPEALLLHITDWTEAVLSRLGPQNGTFLPLTIGLGQVSSDMEVSWPLDTWLSPDALDTLPTLLDQAITTAIPKTPDLDGLTILYLKADLNPPKAFVSHPGFNLSTWLHHQNCRLLEVDDVLQADLLSRVWRPDVVIIDREITQPIHLFAQINQLSNLRTYPLVVFTLSMLEASYQFPDLRIFSCLEPFQAAPSTYAASLASTIYQAADNGA